MRHNYELSFNVTDPDGSEHDFGAYFDTAWDAVQTAECLAGALGLECGDRIMSYEDFTNYINQVTETGHCESRTGRWAVAAR